MARLGRIFFMPNHLHGHEKDWHSIMDHLQKELQSLRTGRASVSLVEGIPVDAYSQKTELKACASITTPDARTIQIEPWDKALVKEVEKALVEADLGMQPNTAGTVIRLALPPMTEENRKQMVKVLRQKEETTKISVRNLREKIRNLIADDEKEKRISKDEKLREQERLDEIVQGWNAKIEKIAEDKEREILTI